MKRYRGLPVFVWILLGLLAIAGALLSLGERESVAHPSSYSYAPSGTAAFADLLRRRGYDIRVDRWPHPRISENDIVIAFKLSEPYGLGASNQTDFFDSFDQRIRLGGRAIYLTVPTQFASASRALLKSGPIAVTERGAAKPLSLYTSAATASAEPAATPENPEDSDFGGTSGDESNDVSVGLWDSGQQKVLVARQVGLGRVLELKDATFMTNRFIDRGDDARAALELVSFFARPNDHIVFTEASFGEAEAPGLLELIGPWANAGWQQLLFLIAVVIYTLGKRFGLPDEARPPQRGARELLDALSDTYRRGRQSHVAMSAALERSDAELRSALRLPRDAPKEARNRLLPGTLSGALTTVELAVQSEQRVSSAEALDLVAKLRYETLEFLGRR